MANFYYVYVEKQDGVEEEKLEEAINKALDWYRINKSTYIFYSSSNAERLYARLSPLVKPDGSVFICKLDINERQGWMSKSFWAWLKKDRKPALPSSS